MERKVCMFTGHRTIATSDLFALPARLDFLIEKLINDGYTDFRCGGAQGFDTIAALKVLEKRKKYPHIKLHLFLPCKDQADRWSENARCAYFMILDAADSVKYEVDVYTKGCSTQEIAQWSKIVAFAWLFARLLPAVQHIPSISLRKTVSG